MSCPKTRYYDDPSYEPEIWLWFIVATLVTVLRLAIRWCDIGIRSLSREDLLVVVVWLCFVGKTVALTLNFEYGSNTDYATDHEVYRLSACQIKRVEFGSKMELLAWYAYSGIIWGLKGIVLCSLHRLRLTASREWLFKIAVASTVVTCVAMFLTISLDCLPFQQNWQVAPVPPSQCSIRWHSVYVSSSLNIATDLVIMAIPIPVLWTMKVSIPKRIGLILLIGSGIFVMSAAIIRLSFWILGSARSGDLNRWCTRETAVGLIAVSAPFVLVGLRPIHRRKRDSKLSEALPRHVQEVKLEEPPPYNGRCGILPSADMSTIADKMSTIHTEGDLTAEELDRTERADSCRSALVFSDGDLIPPEAESSDFVSSDGGLVAAEPDRSISVSRGDDSTATGTDNDKQSLEYGQG